MGLRPKLFLLIITFGILFPIVFISAQTSDATLDLRALIRDLQSQIQALQAQVKTLKQEFGGSSETPVAVPVESAPVPAATPEAVPTVETPTSQPEAIPPELTRSLTRGASGDDVRKLQEFLAKDKEVYPDGLITGFFGPLTEGAVKKWQKKHGIEALGIVGPQTRAKLQDIGRGVIQGLLSEGAGASGVIPPGLLRAPGIQKKLGTTTPPLPATTTPVAVPPTIPTATTTAPTATATSTATTTPAVATATLLATPAIPASPAQPSTGTAAVPATPAVSATTTTTTASSTATTTATTAAPIFTITSPNGDEQMTVGNTYTITWTSADTSVSKVNIDLYKSGNYSTSIVYDVSNNGSMSWAVPATMAAGTDYKIRVYNNTYYNNFDESNNTFTITVPVAPPAAPPIGYWKFDGNGTNEITGNPSAVTVGNATFKASGGKFGGYLYMPANNDYAKIPYNSMFDLQNFTVELWFRQRSNQGFNQNLIYKGTPINNYNFNVFRNLWNQYNNGPVIAGSTAAGTGYWHQVSNQNEPPHNAWHHVVYTKTTEGAAYYIDGVLIHSRNYAADRSPEYAGPVKTPAVDIIIGNPAPDTDIDNLRIYNYALSRGEVLYNLENIPGVVNASDTTAPSVPTNLTATAVSSTQINLLWTASTDTVGVTGYRIYRGGAQIATTATSTYYSDIGLTAGTAYAYTVAAYDAAGNVSSQSAAASATTQNAPTAPLAPSNFTATASGSNVNLSWADNATNETEYVVTQLGINNDILVRINLPANTTSYVHSGVAAGTYKYQVNAYNGIWSSLTSDQVTVTVASSQPPPAPTGGTNAGAYTGAGWPVDGIFHSVRFNFDINNISQVTSFRLYQKRPGDAGFNLLDTFNNPASGTTCSGSSSGARIYGSAWSISYFCSSNFWEANDRSVRTQSFYSQGDYEYYVTTVTDSGESAPSPTWKITMIAPTEIISPAEAQSPVAAVPTFQWTGGGTSVAITLYDEAVLTGYRDSLYSKYGVTGSSKVYDGPALDPSKKYVVKISTPGTIVRTSNGDNTTSVSMVKKLEKFWVSGSTASTLSPIDALLASMAKTVAALSERIERLRIELKK